MSEHAERFIEYLLRLAGKQGDRGAMATLRHSLAFAPGCYPPAYPYVEPFVGNERSVRDARRLALYGVAGLFARHPEHRPQSFASAFGELLRRHVSAGKGNGESVEKRFIALLGADPENVLDYLRQAISLLAATELGLDYARLLDDLSHWMRPEGDRDRLRQIWARDFYRAAQATPDANVSAAS